jgi:hypothetical protein
MGKFWNGALLALRLRMAATEKMLPVLNSGRSHESRIFLNPMPPVDKKIEQFVTAFRRY